MSSERKYQSQSKQTQPSQNVIQKEQHDSSTMGFFQRRRARAEQQRADAAQDDTAATIDGQEYMMSEEARLAAEARRMMLGDDDGTSVVGAASTLITPAQEQKVMALHYHFDADRDGYLSYNELQSLQHITSGAAMSVHEYTMICHALGCEPRRGITLDALRVTYASAAQGEDGDANIDLDYDNVFGIHGASGADVPPTGHYATAPAGASSSAAAAAAAGSKNKYSRELSSIAESDMETYDEEPSAEEAEIPVEVDAPRLEMGDHVFRRRAAGLAQIHAIVVSMAPGEDGPLLLADFTGQNVVGDDDEDEDKDDNDNDNDNDNNEGVEEYDSKGAQDVETKKAIVEEQRPDSTVERVRIICVEGRKNIRRWKKVRYGGSRFGGWFKRSSNSKAETPKRSKSSVVTDDADATSGSSCAPNTPSRASSVIPPNETEDLFSTVNGERSTDDNVDDDPCNGKDPPQQQTPKSKDANKKKDNDLPETDPGTLVVERVNFLLENQNLIPPWYALKSNSECLAVWCKTGRWSTYQVSGYLNTIFMGQAKTAATVAAAASSATVTVPAAGYMGWLGFTTQMSLLALHPWLIPAIAGYGIASIGVPMYILKRCGQQWAKTTIDLNNAFWSQAPPDVFVDCIRKWSGLDDEVE